MATRRGPDGTARVAIQGTHNGTNWANVFWFNLTGGATAPQADLDAWLVKIANQFKTTWAPTQITTVSYVQAKATLFQSGGTVLQSVAAMTGAGTHAATEVNDNGACVVISWLSAVYWRGGKPRTYIASIASGDVSAGHVLGAGVAAAYAADGVAFRTALNAITQGAITGTQHGFVSFRSGNADRVPPVFYPSTGASCHNRIGTQRRRLGKWQQ